MKQKSGVRIAGRLISDKNPTFIIAEIGSNHDGKLSQAKKLIRAAAEAGADAVKFQSFRADGLLHPQRLNAQKKWEPHPAYSLLKKLELPESWHWELKKYCDSVGILFMSTPFDLGRADLLHRVGVPAYKIASGDLTYTQLLRHVARFQKPIILSTGIATLNEVKEAVRLIENEGNKKIILLHCVALYPPKFEEVNIRAMVTLKKTFPRYFVGCSDHTPGWTVPLAAVTLGGRVIEKHLTLDRHLKGPDHPYAMTVAEFAAMVQEIRHLEKALGSGVKKPAPGEIPEQVGARRSLYAAKKIAKGERLDEKSICVVRHAYGLKPKDLDWVVTKRAKQPIPSGSLILKKMLV
jgi:sialic acid synthase SpsE